MGLGGGRRGRGGDGGGKVGGDLHSGVGHGLFR